MSNKVKVAVLLSFLAIIGLLFATGTSARRLRDERLLRWCQFGLSGQPTKRDSVAFVERERRCGVAVPELKR